MLNYSQGTSTEKRTGQCQCNVAKTDMMQRLTADGNDECFYGVADVAHFPGDFCAVTLAVSVQACAGS